ncbi:DUF490 domain-containing protein [Acidithiobacillus caldus]|uniref:translocation/assembly module TamB domain-containing protein n=1 Tax=Acidithiobacillus caldus TaxID=33059 RepID=UPI001C068F49|nr:translocation/assembly module TamB domain-containing protein [Acidithiobacillus caldus]MBU2763064.1 DUF490 domain-containing protein [Acidithiobacillus caldus]
MRARLLQWLLAGFLLPLATLLALLFWLLFTPSGARWALQQVPGLHYSSLRGTLMTGLDAHDLRYASANLHIAAKRLSWRGHPMDLLTGELRLSHLRLETAQVELPPPAASNTALRLDWPVLPLWTRLFTLSLPDAAIHQLSVIQGSAAPFRLDSASWRELRWDHGWLLADKLAATLPQGQLQADASVGIWARRLSLMAHFSPPASRAAGTTEIVLKTHWKSQGRRGIGGPLEVAYRRGKLTESLTSTLLMAPTRLELGHILLHTPALTSPVHGELRVDLPQTLHGDYQIAGQFTGIRPPLKGKPLKGADVALSLHLRGTPQHYAGSVQLIAAPGIARLQTELQGTAQQLDVRYKGAILGGTLLPAQLQLQFKPHLALHGDLRLQELPTQRLDPALPGQISAELHVDAVKAKAGWQGQSTLRLLPSQIHRQSLQGQARVQFSAAGFDLRDARFYGPGVKLTGSGNLQQGLRLAAYVQQWQGLVPGARGHSSLQATLARTGKAWHGSVQLLAEDLHYRSESLRRAQLHATLSPAQILSADAQVEDLYIGKRQVDLELAAMGPLQALHTELKARSAGNRVDLAGELRKTPASWRLQLQTLALDGPEIGPWRLAQPAQVLWQNSGQASIQNFRLNGAHGARIDADGQYSGPKGPAKVDLRLHEIPLDFHDDSMNGGVRGRCDAALKGQCQGSCTLTADWRVQDTVLHWHQDRVAKSLPIQRFVGKLSWQTDGLQLQSDLELGHGFGNMHLHLASPMVLRLPFTLQKQAPLQGTLRTDLAGPLFAALPLKPLQFKDQGSAHLDLTIGGEVAKPQWSGSGRIRDLAFYAPQAGLFVHKIAADLRGNGQELVIDGLQADSGDGQIEGSGSVHWQPALHFQLGIRGNRFTAVNLPQVQAAVSPDLTVRGDSKRIDIAGSVHTDRLRILGTDFGGPQPSSDVVYVKNAKKPSVGPALSADIRVSLGHDAKVLIGGLRAGLAGDLQVRMENGGPPSMDGTLRMVDGHYDIYGNSLTFERGAILFRGPPNAATLDVLAVRTIKNSNSFAVDNRPIQAGVEVNGTLTHPQVSLYSDPSMAQSDILSYLVLGTPSTGLQSQNALLSAAAGQLFSAGSSALFGNHGNGGPGGFDFGVTSNGSNTLSGAMVTLGRYITPDLYLSVGQSIIGQGTVARLRYRLTRNIELQTESGTQNGANIFYRIDF